MTHKPRLPHSSGRVGEGGGVAGRTAQGEARLHVLEQMGAGAQGWGLVRRKRGAWVRGGYGGWLSGSGVGRGGVGLGGVGLETFLEQPSVRCRQIVLPHLPLEGGDLGT